MTRPKKWYLQSANNSDISESASDPVQLVLFNREGPIKKPNALHSLGNVKNVCHPDAGKYPDDYIMFHCERGRIALPTKAYEWNKSVIKERCSSVEAFITMINQLINGRDQSIPVHESSASSSESTDLLSSVHSAHPSSESALLPQTVLQSPQSTSQSPLMLTQVVSQSPQAANQQSPSALPQVVSQSPHVSIQSPSTSFHESHSRQQPTLLRKQTLENTNDSLSKRLKCINDNIDEEIERHRKGLCEIPVSQVMMPPKESRLLRSADDKFTEKLMDKMVLDPSAPGATPMALLCKDVSTLEQFNDRFANVYKYEVLGGLHTLKAKAQLAQMYPDNPFFQHTLAEVYVGLTDEQALRLSQRHNVNSHFIHKITHRDMVEACRARLYRITGKSLDDGTPQVTGEWKESCKRAIIPNGVSTTQCDAIFFQASLPKAVWDLAVEVMDLFENYKLKDQKMQCGLKTITKPEIKQQYLAPIRRLDVNDQLDLLIRCKNKEISLSEMKKESDLLKKLHVLRKTFVKLTNSKDWEDAQSRFHPFASDCELKKFTKLDVSKEIPPSFVNFCRKAKGSRENDQASTEDHVFKYGQLVACVLRAKTSEISGQMITASFQNFHGADMIILSIPEGSSKDDIESIGYTAKEINSTASLYNYNTIAICHPALLHDVQTIWGQLFGNADVMFLISQDFYAKDENKKLDSCVLVAVLGFESMDGSITDAQFVYNEEERRDNYCKGNREEISTYLINHFCCPNGTILDASSDLKGTVSLAALQLGHSVITIMESEESQLNIFQQLQDKFVVNNEC